MFFFNSNLYSVVISLSMFSVFDLIFLQAGSECNHSKLTFDGVDLMGDRLAEEVCLAARF